MLKIQKITPCLWYDDQALQAARFYCDIFPDSRILSESPLIVEFELEGLRFSALNGGPEFSFTEAISFVISCEDQEEVDHYWEKLSAEGGQTSQCGWLKDRFGLSWQIVPQPFVDLMNSGKSDNVQRMIQKMLTMQKLVIVDLEAAFYGG